MNDEFWLWRISNLWIGFVAVVIKQEFSQPWKELNQVQSALRVTLPNSLLGNVVTAMLHPGADTSDV